VIKKGEKKKNISSEFNQGEGGANQIIWEREGEKERARIRHSGGRRSPI
jgi:hypothetical protein